MRVPLPLDDEQLADACKALGHPARLAILRHLLAEVVSHRDLILPQPSATGVADGKADMTDRNARMECGACAALIVQTWLAR